MSEIKITVIPKEKPKPKKAPYFEIEPGTVYEVLDGAAILKVDAKNAVLLKGHAGCDFLGIAHGYKNYCATKILGRLKEIIVEEI